MRTKSKLKPQTIKLLRAVKRKILAEPRQFQMNMFFTSRLDIPKCGTAACIAGWVIAVASKLNPEQACEQAYFTHDEAKNLLRITELQADRLFYCREWPRAFADYSDRLPPIERARRAVRRIEHFIRTGK